MYYSFSFRCCYLYFRTSLHLFNSFFRYRKVPFILPPYGFDILRSAAYSRWCVSSYGFQQLFPAGHVLWFCIQGHFLQGLFRSYGSRLYYSDFDRSRSYFLLISFMQGLWAFCIFFIPYRFELQKGSRKQRKLISLKHKYSYERKSLCYLPDNRGTFIVIPDFVQYVFPGLYFLQTILFTIPV